MGFESLIGGPNWPRICKRRPENCQAAGAGDQKMSTYYKKERRIILFYLEKTGNRVGKKGKIAGEFWMDLEGT